MQTVYSVTTSRWDATFDDYIYQCNKKFINLNECIAYWDSLDHDDVGLEHERNFYWIGDDETIESNEKLSFKSVSETIEEIRKQCNE